MYLESSYVPVSSGFCAQNTKCSTTVKLYLVYFQSNENTRYVLKYVIRFMTTVGTWYKMQIHFPLIPSSDVTKFEILMAYFLELHSF